MWSNRAFLGRINESLCQEVDQLRGRRQEDILNAVSVLRAELTSKSNEITDLNIKRRSALDLLSKYQNKISELIEHNRSYVRQDAEQKAQIHRLKSELNNMQTLLETQSQTIQTYRLHSASIGSKDKHVDELEGELRKKSEELMKQESIKKDLERSLDQLGEQLVALNKRLLERETTIVGLNAQIARMSFDFKRRTIPNSPRQDADHVRKQNQLHDDEASSYSRSAWSSEVVKERPREAATPERFVRRNAPSGNVEFGGVDFINQLEQLGANRTSNSSMGDHVKSFLSPPPSIPSPPRRYSDMDAGNGRIEAPREKAEGPAATVHNGKAERNGFEMSSPPASSKSEAETKTTAARGLPVQSSRQIDSQEVPRAGTAERLDVASRRQVALTSAAATALSSSAIGAAKKAYKETLSQDNSKVKFTHTSKVKVNRKIDKIAGKTRPKQSLPSNDFTDFEYDNKLSPNLSAKKRGRAIPETPGGAFIRDALNSRDSLYDPALFDLLDDIDASHSTISSISRHGGLMWT